MRVEIMVDRTATETQVLIRTPEMNDETNELVRRVEQAIVSPGSCGEQAPEDEAQTQAQTQAQKQAQDPAPATFSRVIGFVGEEMRFLEQRDILRFEARNQKVFAHTSAESALIKQRLHELEDALRGSSFVRISNSEIVNFDKVVGMDLSMAGMLVLKFKSGERSYVSRRYVRKIKDYLGL